MPTGIYSRACGTCKERRVKCDEIKPECGRCRTSGRHCKPFQLRFNFIDQNKVVSRPRSKAQSKSPESHRHDQILSISVKSPLPPELRLGYEIFTRSAFAYYSAGRTGNDVFWHATENERTAALSKAIEKGTLFAGYSVCLPSRFGHDSSLDAAITCVLSTLADVYRNGQLYDPRKSHGHYILALRLLRQSIADCYGGETANVGNIAGAALLLAVYESLVGVNMSSWSTHIGGLATLYANQGPTRTRSTFEDYILLAAMGGFVAEAMLENRPCFLETAQWQTSLYDTLTGTLPSPSDVRPTYIFLSTLSRIPGILSTCRKIIDLQSDSKDRTAYDLVQRVKSMRADLLKLSPAPPQLSGGRGGIWSVFSEEEQDIGNYCNFLMTLALLNRVLISIQGGPVVLEEEAYSMAKEVVDMHKSVLDIDAAWNSPDPGSRSRILHLRYAFTIIQTHSSYLQHSLLSSGASDSKMIDTSIFHDFHERIRGHVLV